MTTRGELLADAVGQPQRRGRLADAAARPCSRRLPASCSARASGVELARRRGRAPGDRRLDQPLRDQIRKAPVRRGRVRVVGLGEREVRAFRRPAAPGLGDVLAAAEQLQDAQRQVGETPPDRPPAARSGTLERARVRSVRQRRAVRGGDLHDARPALGRADDPPDRRPSRARSGSARSRRWRRS